mgnify:CR=1 FL=1|jgi:hypothetical protein
MAESAFVSAVTFLEQLGVFEIVLPFFLVFTLVFAYLEKTKVFGTETYKSPDDGDTYELPRKNLNSVVALTTAFFVIASAQLVRIISEIASSMVLILMLGFSFTLVVGAFSQETEEGFYLEGTWAFIFQWIAFLAIGLIFLNALDWLEPVLEFIRGAATNQAAASVLMLLVLGGLIWYIVGGSRIPNEGE